MTPTPSPFETHTDRYEHWFDANEAAYRSELAALEGLLPDANYGLEIGVGTGRFAGPLGIEVGVDPAVAMLERARDRGIDVVRGVAEHLPFADDTFDVALVVTTICFVDDIPATLAEADRILHTDGVLLLGYIDRDSPVGRVYQANRDTNPFYRDAHFVSTDELRPALTAAGFTDLTFVQTIDEWPGDMTDPDPVRDGYGEGSFVGLAARR